MAVLIVEYVAGGLNPETRHIHAHPLPWMFLAFLVALLTSIFVLASLFRILFFSSRFLVFFSFPSTSLPLPFEPLSLSMLSIW